MAWPILDQPTKFSYKLVDQRGQSDYNEGIRYLRKRTRVSLASCEIEWMVTATVLRQVDTYYRANLNKGTKWFGLQLPIPENPNYPDGVGSMVRWSEPLKITPVDGDRWMVSGVLDLLRNEPPPPPDLFEYWVTSPLYPIYVQEELSPEVTLLSGSLANLITLEPTIEEMGPVLDLTSGELRDLLIITEMDPEEIHPLLDLLSGSLDTILVTTDMDPEEIQATALNFLSGTLRTILVENDMIPEEIEPTLALLSGTLS